MTIYQIARSTKDVRKAIHRVKTNAADLWIRAARDSDLAAMKELYRNRVVLSHRQGVNEVAARLADGKNLPLILWLTGKLEYQFMAAKIAWHCVHRNKNLHILETIYQSDPAAFDIHDNYVLELAVRNDNVDLVRWLVREGVECESRRVAHLARTINNPDVLDALRLRPFRMEDAAPSDDNQEDAEEDAEPTTREEASDASSSSEEDEDEEESNEDEEESNEDEEESNDDEEEESNDDEDASSSSSSAASSSDEDEDAEEEPEEEEDSESEEVEVKVHVEQQPDGDEKKEEKEEVVIVLSV